MLALIMTSCEEENYEFGDFTVPSNIEISTEIVGQDAEHPYGDGSGKVNFTVTSNDAITYKFLYNGMEESIPSGEKSEVFTKLGVNKHMVTFLAYGTAGTSSSKTIEVEVEYLYVPPADLLAMLTGGSSRTWRIKAESLGHFGVGPADSFDPIWWSATPFQKDGVGAYDDRFIFNVDGTFTHITNGDTFGKLDPMASDLAGDQGFTPDANGEAENYAWDDYSENWVLTAPGGTETLTFSNIGYHGFYVGGDHSYKILSRSDNEMTIRTIGAGGLAWYAILIAED
ncbi:MAG: glucan endo-1,3-beta-D-glucosidase [Flavobacteriaceae bacterium]|nr:glucan endo-1,3-beta-D-glucosidase [Flavobacteriaceae bacterium]